jgi:DNA-binding PadR family transcriptional regulator
MGPSSHDFDWGAWVNMCCGPGFRFDRGRRKRRVFRRGDLKYMVLGLLEEKSMHGYEVMQRLEEESGGYYTASPGSVYPVLQMLEDQEYVRSEQADGKRVYHITDQGRAFLHEHRDRVEDVADRVDEFASMFGGRGMGSLTRTFMRMAQVSLEKSMEAAGDRASVESLREVLERVTGEIEAWQRPTRAAE